MINNLGGHCAMKDAAGDPRSCVDTSAIITNEEYGWDETKPWLYFQRIGHVVLNGTSEPIEVDLKVEVAAGSVYRPADIKWNGYGRNGAFGQINMGGRSEDMDAEGGKKNEATFIFTLIDGRTRDMVVGGRRADGKAFKDGEIKFFAFTYFDFDQAGQGRGKECVELPPADTYDVTFKGGLVSQPAPNKFCSTQEKYNENNPQYPSDIGNAIWRNDQIEYDGGREEVKEAALTLEFFDSNTIQVKYSVEGCCISKGRNILFSGAIAPLMPCELPPPSAPASPSPPSPLPLPPPPPAVILTLTASGSVSDYSNTSSLQQRIAAAAAVDKSLVNISVAAASVIITAIIAVPESTTVAGQTKLALTLASAPALALALALVLTITLCLTLTTAAVHDSLSSKMGTAGAASEALGVTVESTPEVAIASSSLQPPPPARPPFAPPSPPPPTPTPSSDKGKPSSNAIIDDTAADASTAECNIVCALDILTLPLPRFLTLTRTSRSPEPEPEPDPEN